jgi:hypothetical protein
MKRLNLEMAAGRLPSLLVYLVPRHLFLMRQLMSGLNNEQILETYFYSCCGYFWAYGLCNTAR